MTDTMTPNGGEPERRGLIPITVQSKEEATAAHVGIVLSIANTMRGILSVDLSEGVSENVKREAFLSASTTLTLACSRLDEILGDAGRWGLENLNELHRAIIDVHEKQKKLLDLNMQWVEMQRRPSYYLRPRIATASLDHFIAFWGNLEEPGMSVIGRGATPELALRDFDAAFHRTPREQIQIITERVDGHQEPQPLAETPEEFKKQNPPAPPTNEQ